LVVELNLEVQKMRDLVEAYQSKVRLSETYKNEAAYFEE